MTISVYDFYATDFLSGNQNPATDIWRAILVKSSYVFDPVHKNRVEISVDDVVSVSNSVNNGSVTNKIFTLGSMTFPAVAAGQTATGLILFSDYGDTANDLLALYIDEQITGLPITTNGEDIVLNFGPNGIWKIP